MEAASAAKGGDDDFANDVAGCRGPWRQKGPRVGLSDRQPECSSPLAYGVYASQTRIAGADRVWPSVTSYGTRPTFDGADQRVETHILDFSGDIYGQEIEVEFVAFIRAEARFDNVDALIAAMQCDKEHARVINAA